MEWHGETCGDIWNGGCLSALHLKCEKEKDIIVI